tara:strand:- start:2565 stop:3995 length:1431 start_codon:yes stop_codon:yes gene_type:complete
MAFDPKQPYATNKFHSRGLFYNRKKYKVLSYPQHPAFPKPIDLWYKKEFYGRMDPYQNAIQIDPSSLVEIESEKADKPVLVMNFVAEAFDDFREYMTAATFQGKVKNPKTTYYDLQPIFGWKSIDIDYSEYMNKIYVAFVESFMGERRNDEKLVSFESFLRLFPHFLNRICPAFVFTKSAFILSKYCSPMSSGLMIELAHERHDDDKIKYDEFIKDENFYFFLKSAQRFGFVVDKNAPWRIVADLGSQAMQGYMENSGTNLETVLLQTAVSAYSAVTVPTVNNLSQSPDEDEDWSDAPAPEEDENGVLWDASSGIKPESIYMYPPYKEVYLEDISEMKWHLMKFYNDFAKARPQARVWKVTPRCSNSGVTNNNIFKTIHKRMLISEIDENRLDEMYWLRYYAWTRVKELERPWTQMTFERLMKTARQLNKYQNAEAALSFLNRRLRGPHPKILSLTKTAIGDRINEVLTTQPIMLF